MRIVPVNQGDGWAHLLALDKLGHRHAIEQVVIEPLVGRLQPFIQGRATQLAHQIVHRFGRQRIALARKHKGALGQHVAELLAQYHLIGLAIPRRQRLFGG
ncbi:hypothetical protein D3C77_394950 [compost metagenome]